MAIMKRTSFLVFGALAVLASWEIVHADHNDYIEVSNLDGIAVKVAAIGLEPTAGNADSVNVKCDKVLYEQVAMKMALDHILTGSEAVLSKQLVSLLPDDIAVTLAETSNEAKCIMGNITNWARNNIEECSVFNKGHDDVNVMIHGVDDMDVVNFILGPRGGSTCSNAGQTSNVGRIPLISWGCTYNEISKYATTSKFTVSTLPFNAELVKAQALMDFLHDHNWDNGNHIAVIFDQDDSQSVEFVQTLVNIASCGDEAHPVHIQAYGLMIHEDVSAHNFEIKETLSYIQSLGSNIIVSTLNWNNIAPVLYLANEIDLVGKDMIWIHMIDFSPIQLQMVSQVPLKEMVTGFDDDKLNYMYLSDLLDGSFSISWTPGGADYTVQDNPWSRFKRVWQEQDVSSYPRYNLPDNFFDYPPYNINAALVYDSVWAAFLAYFGGIRSSYIAHNMTFGHNTSTDHHAGGRQNNFLNISHVHHDHLHEDDDHDSSAGHQGSHSSSEAGHDDSHDPSTANHHDDHDATVQFHDSHDESSTQWNNHYHVCEDDHNVFMPAGLSFDGVTGRVEINPKNRGRAPIAGMITAMNFQWTKSSNSLEAKLYGRWPWTWNSSWTDVCDFPNESLWARNPPLSMKYGDLKNPPQDRSILDQEEKEKEGYFIIVIALLVSSLGLLSVGVIFLLYRYKRAQHRINQNEKILNEFQFEWDTNAGKALTMLNSLIDNLTDHNGNRRGDSAKSFSFEKKLSEIRRFILAQDTCVDMRQVKTRIEEVGAERYTPEVTAYLMEQALNNCHQDGTGEHIYQRTASFQKYWKANCSRSSLQDIIQNSLKQSEKNMAPLADTSCGFQRSLSSVSYVSDSLEAISPVVDNLVLEQVRTNLISALDLAAAGSPNFNVFDLAILTGDRPLSTLLLFLLHRRGVVSAMKLNPDKLIAYVLEVENNMFEHHYHNRRHVADVTAGIYAFTLPGGCLYPLVKQSPLAMLSVLFAAAVHDLQHPGVNNDYLIKTLHPLAIRHSDQSVNEHHHLSCAFDVLSQDEYNFFGETSKDQFHQFRRLVIDMVLATDMKSHFAILDSFMRFQNAKSEKTENLDQMQEMKMVFELGMKVADLIHCARSTDVHRKWVDLITKEFFSQGDLEKEKQIRISPGMDRTQAAGAIEQVGFIEVFVLPLFKAFRDYAQLYGSKEGAIEILYYEGLENNYSYWLQSSKSERKHQS